MIHILYMYHLPKELVLYIWEYDSTYCDKYKGVMQELKDHCNDYNKSYFKYTQLHRCMFWSGCLRKTKELMDWSSRFGVNYDPGYYILNKNTDKHYNYNVVRGINPSFIV